MKYGFSTLFLFLVSCSSQKFTVLEFKKLSQPIFSDALTGVYFDKNARTRIIIKKHTVTGHFDHPYGITQIDLLDYPDNNKIKVSKNLFFDVISIQTPDLGKIKLLINPGNKRYRLLANGEIINLLKEN